MGGYRDKALEFWSRVCRSCGTKEPEKRFEVHHVDGDRSNNSVLNLAVLCQKCHREHHREGGVSNVPDGRSHVTISASVPKEIHARLKKSLLPEESMKDRLNMLIRMAASVEPESRHKHLFDSVSIHMSKRGMTLSEEFSSTTETVVLSDEDGESTVMLMRRLDDKPQSAGAPTTTEDETVSLLQQMDAADLV